MTDRGDGAGDGGGGARAALVAAAARLAATSDTARLDAEVLLAHAIGRDRLAMLLDIDRVAVPGGYGALIDRRAGGEPVAYITGARDFHGVTIAVAPGALVPRPDSETLIEAAIAAFAGTPGPGRVLDLGCGPGTLLIAALAHWGVARGTGFERSGAALALAERNAAANGVAARATFVAGDWSEGDWTGGLGGPFDLILCNPPYVPDGTVLMRDVIDHEPAEALFGGPDGLDAYRTLLPAMPRLMAAGGVAVIEIGHDQAAAVAALAAAAGLDAALLRDLGGRPRGFVLTRDRGTMK